MQASPSRPRELSRSTPGPPAKTQSADARSAAFDVAWRRKSSRSTIARSISPAPTASPESSKACSSKVSRPAAGSDGSAMMSTLPPNGVARRCLMRTAIPTDVWPAVRNGPAAWTVVASIHVTSRDVASTGTSPVPRVVARSASVTSNRTARKLQFLGAQSLLWALAVWWRGARVHRRSDRHEARKGHPERRVGLGEAVDDSNPRRDDSVSEHEAVSLTRLRCGAAGARGRWWSAARPARSRRP